MIQFTKMHGIGNDFVMLDGLGASWLPDDLSSLAIEMCDRHYGIGADGLIIALPGISACFRMQMFNPDGSESEMCGNGLRCFARFLHETGHTRDSLIEVETGAGLLKAEFLGDEEIRLDMGQAKLSRTEIGMTPGGNERFIDQPIGEYVGTAVSMGNPHLVIFVPDVSRIELAKVGPKLENHPLFPKRTNVHFAQVVSPTHLIQRTWERGAGITCACGTGACAVAVAGSLTGRSERAVQIDLPGGQLKIEYTNAETVFMTGPATTLFTGSYGFDPIRDETDLDLSGITETELLEHI